LQGIQGETGPKGDTGSTGATGAQGIQGVKGDKGDTGLTGAQGPKGDTGEAGPAGAAGADGEDGRYIVSTTAPSGAVEGDVWFDSTIGRTFIYYDSFWVEANPNQIGPEGPVGPIGADGADGADGAPGKFITSDTPPASPTSGDSWFDSTRGKTYVYYNDGDSSQWVQIGSAQTGASGVVSVTAPITNTGTNNSAVLGFATNPSLSGVVGTNGGYKIDSSSQYKAYEYFNNGTRRAVLYAEETQQQLVVQNEGTGPLVFQNGGSTRMSIANNGNISMNGNLSAAAISTTGGRLTVAGSSVDTSGVLELQSFDGAKNYVYKQNGGGLVFSSQFGTTAFFNSSGHLTLPSQPMWNSDITSSTNNYSTFNATINVGFTQTNSSTITVQTAGKYYVRAQQLLQTSGGGYYQLRKNNVTIKHAYSPSSVFMDFGVGALLDLAAGDTIRIVAAFTLSNQWSGDHSTLDIIKVA
jgi:hypothetical protein